ncbi:unnamed protein product [Darwinula stevensoni]|uniref:Serine/threonine-protein phosphatase n=1 Tax=Darwinula stevensoni TaxID=69355 RepID=A0A7R9A3M6_9CRUS|nr:unnamed protein product [Darwinula stevensoni]CAG0882444.1 unnamed protein product [Darwinula stevensoni]
MSETVHVDDIIRQLVSLRKRSPSSAQKTVISRSRDEPSYSLPQQQATPEATLLALNQAARELLLGQPMLLELAAPVNVVGDVHGQFHDLLRHFDYLGYPPAANYLFLGDYVDRGMMSVETISLVLAYKVKYPRNFFLLRGNHECAAINRIYGFYDECKRKYSVKLWKSFTDTFNCLPIAAIVEGSIFCTHGGLSPELKKMEQVRRTSRPTDIPDRGLVCDLVWSDPGQGVDGWIPNDRGVSWIFGRDIVKKFLDEQGLSLIVRGHQVVEDGYEFFANRALVTVFSAPNYCGEFDNAGATMSISENLICSFSILKVSVLRTRCVHQMRRACRGSMELLTSQPMLLELNSSLNVLGDFHNQFHDLLSLRLPWLFSIRQ